MGAIIHVNPYAGVITAAEQSVAEQWAAHEPLTPEQIEGLKPSVNAVFRAARSLRDGRTVYSTEFITQRPTHDLAIENIKADATKKPDVPRIRDPYSGRLLIYTPKIIHVIPKRVCTKCQRTYTEDDFRKENKTTVDEDGNRTVKVYPRNECIYCEREAAKVRGQKRRRAA